MRVRIEESFPGELDGMTGAGMRRRADLAIQKALGPKLPERGGEVALVEELAQGMSEHYEDRMQQMMRDFAECLLEDGRE